MTAKSERPGYYVNGRHYSLANRSQAIARSEWLCNEFGRLIHVHRVDAFQGAVSIDYTARPDAFASSMRLVVGSL